MKKVTPRARVTEIDSLSDALVRLYKAEAADSAVAKDAFLKVTMDEVERLSGLLTTAIRQDAVSSRLDEADSVRDDAVRSLGMLIEGYTAIPIAAKKAAAQSLLSVYSKYGKKIVSESYANESSLIESMLEDFSAAAVSSSANLLDGIPEAIAALREAQDAFNAASDEYTASKAGKGESATALKKPLVCAVNERIVPYLTAVAGDGGYRDFASRVESEIEKINASVSRRSSEKKAGEAQ